VTTDDTIGDAPPADDRQPSTVIDPSDDRELEKAIAYARRLKAERAAARPTTRPAPPRGKGAR